MPVRSVQISMDEELLERIDGDPETREKGRSAFIRSAVEKYLAAKERREIEARLVQAYSGQADAMLEEVEDLLDGQTWPSAANRCEQGIT
jgi:metal-responsive CopG/Arc/MetJ family transcriptional regulator